MKPVYASHVPYDDLRSWEPDAIMSWCDKANQFYLKGQWHIAQVIRDLVRQVARRPIPRARKPGAGLYFKSLLFDTDLRWNRNLQGYRQMRLIYQPTKKKDDIYGDELASLNKWGLTIAPKSGLDMSEDPFGFERLRSILRSDSLSNKSGLGRESRSPSYRRILSDHTLPGLFGSMCTSWARAYEVPYLPTFTERVYLTEVSGAQRARNGLDISRTELDFGSSVKRGGFKPKRRWVNIY